MSDHLIRRFSRFQIVLHWLVAVPYLTLAVSGALLLVQRLGFFEQVPRTAVARLHHFASAVLLAALVQLVITTLVGGRARAILRDYLESVRIRPRDLVWLLRVPLNVLFPQRFHLPPTGQFNAGQKLHAIFITVAILLFGVTGIMMAVRPADLRPWILHSWLFFLASAFLLVHLFLGLVNPPTRQALKGIFTGFVSRRYAQEHHPLTLAPTLQETKPHAVVSLRWLLAVLIIATVGAFLLAWRYGPQQSAAGTWRRAHPMIFPGLLIAAHADDPRTSRCETCHEALNVPSDSACLACHPQIAQIMRESIGYHGRLKGHCRECHPDHLGRDADIRGLDSRSFNHRLARFRLNGRHAHLECDQCHLQLSGKPGQRRYVQMTFGACLDCHVNPHQDSRADDCSRCHNEQGWKGRYVLFDHQRDTMFHLDGRHTQVPCEKCHSAGRTSIASATSPATRPAFLLTGIGRTCADCHTDLHQPSLGDDCQRCHTTNGWTGMDLLFRHDRDTTFRLEAAHAVVKCNVCHKLPSPEASLARATLKGVGTQCHGCHTDPHKGQFDRECTVCHTQIAWTGRQLLFRHERDSRFLLRGHHAETACIKCHRPPAARAGLARARFVGTPVECADCHRDPHGGQFDKGCSSCHTEQGWKGRRLLFDHNRDSRFQIDTIHRDLECAACHKRTERVVAYRPLPTTCRECHVPVAEAMAGKIGERTTSADPHNERVRCIDCHPTDSRSPDATALAKACVKCHNQRYGALFLDWRRSLDERIANIEGVISTLRSAQPDAAETLGRQLSEARRVGMHNVEAAAQMLDELAARHHPPHGSPK